LTDALKMLDKDAYVNVCCKTKNVKIYSIDGCTQCYKTLAFNNDTDAYHCVRKYSVRTPKCKPPIMMMKTAWGTVSQSLIIIKLDIINLI